MSDSGFFFGVQGAQHPWTQVFYANSATGTSATWQVWDKPRGCSMVYGIVKGGGGGGGNGFTAAAAAARGGGGGGGGAGSVRFVIPALLLPDRLYVQVGKGGAAVTAGDGTYISGYQSTNQNAYLGFGGGGGAGGTGTGAAAGAAGSAGAGTRGFSPAAFGMFVVTVNGGGGGAGGAQTGAAGAAVTFGDVTGGAGGGGVTGTDQAGGQQSSPVAAWMPTVAGPAAGSNRGTDGYFSWGGQFVGGIGGTGGASSNSGVGGAGGNGSLGGYGGGGGGGGTTGGTGGLGGDGIAILVAW